MIESPVARQLRTLRLIWMAFVASIFLYGLVLSIQPAQPVVDVGQMRSVFVPVALAEAAIGIWWRRRSTSTTPAAKLDPQSFTQLQANCIIVWALGSSIAIQGLILGFLSHDIGEFLPFAAAGLALLYVNRPNAWPQLANTGVV